MKLLTFARNLKRRKAREREQLFVAEGIRTVEELLASPLKIRGILITPELQKTARGAELLDNISNQRERRDYGVAEVSEADFAGAAETESPQGVLAIGEIPERSFEGGVVNRPGYRALVLDGVQDPGNVGTILRTAAALGVNETIALPGTVDLWNAKVVRASMGAHFRHKAFAATMEELRGYLEHHRVPLWIADADGEAVEDVLKQFRLSVEDDRTGGRLVLGQFAEDRLELGGFVMNQFVVDWRAPDRLALAVGNEGGGISPEVRAGSARTVALPIQQIDSLNVAVATGILLYTIRPTSQG